MSAVRAEEAVERLRSTGRREVTARRTVGYAILIQKGGWELIEQLLDPGSAVMLRRAFEEAAVTPDEITFPEGDHAYLEELVRSSYHPAAAALGRKLLTG